MVEAPWLEGEKLGVHFILGEQRHAAIAPRTGGHTVAFG